MMQEVDVVWSGAIACRGAFMTSQSHIAVEAYHHEVTKPQSHEVFSRGPQSIQVLSQS